MLDGESEFDAEKAFLFGGEVSVVGESPHVVYADKFEDVLDADTIFHIGLIS